MTRKKAYSFLMENLLASPAVGVLFLIFLLLLSFLGVHAAFLIKETWTQKHGDKKGKNGEKSERSAPQKQEKPQTPTPAASAPEPVYFIVERKKKRTRKKDDFEPPREIKFQ